MAQFTWGDLVKSQVDNQSIVDAINALVSAHNDDPDAHLGESRSLQSHKASEIIDHLALSIISDKIASGQLLLNHFSYNRLFVPISPKDLDISGLGTSSFIGSVYAELSTGPTTSIFYTAYTGGDEEYNKIGDITLSPHFRIRALPKFTTSQEIFFGIGDFGGDDMLGFQIVNNEIFPIWFDGDGVESGTFSDTIDITIPHSYEVDVKYGEYIQWLVDGVVQLQVDWYSGINAQGGNTGLNFQVKKTTSSARTLIVYQIILEQDYF